MTNLFDLLCRLIETYPERINVLKPFVESAAIFHLDRIVQATEASDVRELFKLEYPFGEAFFLPFDTTAILSPYSLVIIQNTEPDAVGLNIPRRFLVMGNRDDGGIPGTAPAKDEAAGIVDSILGRPAAPAAVKAPAVKHLGFFTGTIYDVRSLSFDPARDTMRYAASIEPEWCCLFNDDCSDLRTFVVQSSAKIPLEVWEFLIDAYRNIGRVNTPVRFIVEETTDGMAKAAAKQLSKRNPRLLRSGLRPQYTLLRPSEIRRIRGDLERNGLNGSHAPPCPHMRRAHTRTLRNERFVNAIGKVLKIRARWIGDSEFHQGTKHYKVLLDR